MVKIGVIFSGAQGEQIEQTVIGLLKTFMVDKFAADPYKSRLAKWGGVNITDTDKDAEEFVTSAKPFIFMSIASGAHQRKPFRKKVDGVIHRGAQHEIDVVLELCVTTRCLNAIKPLRDAVGNMLDVAYFDLEAIGLTHSSINPTSNNSQGAQLFNPHTFSCICYTIPKPD